MIYLIWGPFQCLQCSSASLPQVPLFSGYQSLYDIQSQGPSDLVISRVPIFFVQDIYEELQWVLLLGFHSENWMGVLYCRPQYHVPLEIYVKILDKEQWARIQSLTLNYTSKSNNLRSNSMECILKINKIHHNKENRALLCSFCFVTSVNNDFPLDPFFHSRLKEPDISKTNKSF